MKGHSKYDNRPKEKEPRKHSYKILGVECDHCGTRYSDQLDTCPACKTVNFEKFNQRHPYRLYQKVDDSQE